MAFKKIDKHLGCKLTDDELRARGDKIAELIVKRNELIEDKKRVAKDYKEQLDGIVSEVDLLASQLRSKQEWRTVECEERPVFKRKVMEVVRLDTGETCGTRPLLPDEMQPGLFEGEPTAGN